jgi:hypothetical protein
MNGVHAAFEGGVSARMPRSEVPATAEQVAVPFDDAIPRSEAAEVTP